MSTQSHTRALHDVADIAGRSYVWRALAFYDIRSRYRFSVLGTLWIVMSTAVTAVSVGLIYGQFFGQDISDYLPYFTAGLIVWTFISSVMNEASATLIGAGNLIKSAPVPITVHIMRMLHRNFLVFLHNLIILAGLWLFLAWQLHASMLTAAAGLALLYVFLGGVAVVISFVSVRYRDIPPMVAAGSQFLFLASPIIWHQDSIRYGAWIVTLNPIAYFLQIVRDPLLGQSVPLATWSIALLLTLASAGLATIVYLIYRDRIAYWV